MVTLPCGVELAGLLALARTQFVRLQAAWDAGDLELLGELTTPQLWRDLCDELQACALAPNRTEVLTLEAQLIGFEDLPGAWLASIEFTGMMREVAEEGAAPFREWWLLAREKADSPSPADAPWRLVRQHTLL